MGLISRVSSRTYRRIDSVIRGKSGPRSVCADFSENEGRCKPDPSKRIHPPWRLPSSTTLVQILKNLDSKFSPKYFSSQFSPIKQPNLHTKFCQHTKIDASRKNFISLKVNLISLDFWSVNLESLFLSSFSLKKKTILSIILFQNPNVFCFRSRLRIF